MPVTAAQPRITDITVAFRSVQRGCAPEQVRPVQKSQCIGAIP